MYGWASSAILGEEINKLGPSTTTPAAADPRSSQDGGLEMAPLFDEDPLSTPHDESPSSSSSSSVKRQQQQQRQSDRDADDDDDDRMAGVYLGIHNIFATIPQFLATFLSMIVFSILEPGQSPELAAGGAEQTEGGWANSGLSGTAVCLAIGAVFQFVAAAKSLRMGRF